MNALLGSLNYPVISTHTDELMTREQNYGDYHKPADYLESFNDFVRNQLNQSVALGVVVNRPQDLTREQLREVRLLLDGHGYSEVNLQSAWRNQTNQEIAASIVGFIRRAALGGAAAIRTARIQSDGEDLRPAPLDSSPAKVAGPPFQTTGARSGY